MNDENLKVQWVDRGRDPQCAPNPNFPHGIDLDASEGSEQSCYTSLPYPAKRCGFYHVRCTICQVDVMLTTAGRPDDPRSLKLKCRVTASPAVH